MSNAVCYKTATKKRGAIHMDAGTRRKPSPLERRDPQKCSCGDKFLSLFFPCSSTLPSALICWGGTLKRWTFMHLCSQTNLSSSPGCDGKPRRGMKCPCIVSPLPANTKRKRAKKEEEKHQQKLSEYARSRETKNECA